MNRLRGCCTAPLLGSVIIVVGLGRWALCLPRARDAFRVAMGSASTIGNRVAMIRDHACSWLRAGHFGDTTSRYTLRRPVRNQDPHTLHVWPQAGLPCRTARLAATRRPWLADASVAARVNRSLEAEESEAVCRQRRISPWTYGAAGFGFCWRWTNHVIGSTSRRRNFAATWRGKF